MTDNQNSDADRLHALETESHDSEYAEERSGQGGHEDRLGALEQANEERSDKSDARQDLSDKRSDKSDLRIDGLETIPFDNCDRITKLESNRGLAIKALTSARELYRDFIPFVAIAIAAWALYTAVQQVEKVETSNVRNCSRSNINAAVISLSAMEPRTNPPGAITKQIADRLYPVLACQQSLKTGRAIPLSATEKARYITLIKQGRAPIVEDGKVVGSRPSILQSDSYGPPSPKPLGRP